MKELRRADFEAVLGFLGDVAELSADDGYLHAFLGRLRTLIRCDYVLYQEYEYSSRRFVRLVGSFDDGPFSWDAALEEAPEEDAVYWELGPCPIARYRYASSDLSALRTTDVMARREFVKAPLYREYFRPGGVEHMLDLGLASSGSASRAVTLFRSGTNSNFNERERATLEILRPHTGSLTASATLGGATMSASDREQRDTLTPREREIVELVAQGKTNAEIAAALWVAPSTVKKHLEHIYAKLGVSRRAAVAFAHAGRTA